MRILGEDGEVDHVKISSDIQGAKTEQQDEAGEIQKIYNLQVGRYDVLADVSTSYATKRQESADSMMSLVQSYPNIMPIAGDLIVKNLDWAGADAIADRMKKMLPPQLQEQPEGTETPEMQQAAQQANQMADQMQHMSQEIARLSDDRDLKEKELQIKWYDAETKRLTALAGSEPSPTEPDMIALEKHASDMADAEHARQLAIIDQHHKINMDLNPPQPTQPTPQETPAIEQAEPQQEPAAIEQSEPATPVI